MSRKKRWIWSLLSLLLAIASIWVVFVKSGHVDLAELFGSIRDSDKRWIFVAVLCSMLYIVLEGEAVLCILRGLGYKKSFGSGLLYSSADIYFSAITPSATGGQPASAVFMMHSGIPGGVVTVTLLVNLIMYTVSTMTLGLLTLVAYFPVFLSFSTFAKVCVLVGFAVLLGLMLVYLLLLHKGKVMFALLKRLVNFIGSKRLLRRPENKLARLEKAQEDYDNCVQMMRGKTGMLVKAFLWNLIQRAAQMAVPMFVFLAFGGVGHLAGKLFASQCLFTIGYSYMPVPGAMGVADYLMIDGFSSLVGSAMAYKLDMLGRGISFYVCIAVCGIITIAGTVAMNRKKKDREEHDRRL